MRLDANVAKGVTSNVGGGFSVGNEKWNVGLYTTVFDGAGIGQHVGGFRTTLGGVSIAYENDGAPFPESWRMNDGGDRFRTNAVSIGYGDWDIRLNMFTGDSYGEVDESENARKVGHPIFGLKTGGGDDYRLGVLSLGYKGNRLGWNSEGIRHAAQNWFAHTIVKPQGYFRRLPSGYPGSLYTSTTRFNNPYSLWTF